MEPEEADDPIAAAAEAELEAAEAEEAAKAEEEAAAALAARRKRHPILAYMEDNIAPYMPFHGFTLLSLSKPAWKNFLW